jgi:hypothetical protein
MAPGDQLRPINQRNNALTYIFVVWVGTGTLARW